MLCLPDLMPTSCEVELLISSPFTIGQNYLEAHENLLVLNIRIADLDNWLIGLLFLHFPFLWKERFVWGIGPYWAVWFCRCNTLYYWRKDCISNWFHRMRNPSIQIVQTKRIYTQEYYVVSTAVCRLHVGLQEDRLRYLFCFLVVRKWYHASLLLHHHQYSSLECVLLYNIVTRKNWRRRYYNK